MWTRRLRMPLDKAGFAQVPLLNVNQLVVSWREMLPNPAETEYRNISIDVPGAGVYLVEAVNGALRADTAVIVANVAVITKSFPGQVLAERDEVVVSGIVHNYLPSQKQVRFSLAAKGVELPGDSEESARVSSGHEARVDWRLARSGRLGPYRWLIA